MVCHAFRESVISWNLSDVAVSRAQNKTCTKFHEITWSPGSVPRPFIQGCGLHNCHCVVEVSHVWKEISVIMAAVWCLCVSNVSKRSYAVNLVFKSFIFIHSGVFSCEVFTRNFHFFPKMEMFPAKESWMKSHFSVWDTYWYCRMM